MNKKQAKAQFADALQAFVLELREYSMTADGQWAIKGFIDAYQNVYTISSDTKIVSKILEIHLFPRILHFAEQHGYIAVPTTHQNYYPDVSFVSNADNSVRFAVDFKTTYRLPDYPGFCNGFTLGSHGEYFRDRTSKKNVQFPYGTYLGHFCLAIIYSRSENSGIDDTDVYTIDQLGDINSVIKDFEFFVAEKWTIASDRPGSGNTANIGSIDKIDDLIAGNGTFRDLGEAMFDDYWINYKRIARVDPKTGKDSTITNIADFLAYRNIDAGGIVVRAKRSKQTLPPEVIKQQEESFEK